ncbi:MAG TPA: TMEM175 family protein [Chitinophagaceae bacterium]|nr:TMEM175 family protein [Chitinophagaceae bacterium]
MSENKSLARLALFSDGVFAIAITLLILEIKVPPIDSIHSVNDLVSALVHLWPSFFAFVYSFGGILVQWIIHHSTFNHLDKTSRTFIYTNGFLLLTIVFFPFPTALLAEYINTDYAMPAIVFYGMASVANSFAWFLFIRSVQKPKRLLNDVFSHEEYNKLKASNRFAFVVYLSTAILAVWFPYTALIINIAVWLLWIWLSLKEKE